LKNNKGSLQKDKGKEIMTDLYLVSSKILEGEEKQEEGND